MKTAREYASNILFAVGAGYELEAKATEIVAAAMKHAAAAERERCAKVAEKYNKVAAAAIRALAPADKGQS